MILIHIGTAHIEDIEGESIIFFFFLSFCSRIEFYIPTTGGFWNYFLGIEKINKDIFRF